MLTKPLWDGSSLDNKTILLHAEQGLGDTFQFVRYAQILKQRYAVKIILASQDPLIHLLRLCPYLDQVVSLFERLPHHDVQVPLMSVPFILKTRLDSVPTPIPYLYSDTNLTRDFKNKLHGSAFKIGICWQGNSNYSTHFLRTAVAAKSVQLQQFLPLLNLDNVMVYNLQKMTGEEQTDAIRNYKSFICFDKDFDGSHGRFMDTAAVMRNLDLMITVDTSIAHLAGGLGIPTWVLLPEPADWRWMINRTDTPWYPTMRLFRQPKTGDWESVIAEIVRELKKLMSSHQQDNKKDSLNTTIGQVQHNIHEHELMHTFDAEFNELTLTMHRLIKERAKMKQARS